ncbi:MAG: hypothetical protein Q8T13_13705 [Acidobacteriota bacterium]|nr:hypothetical protein [Acidobacteriota bacterium]
MDTVRVRFEHVGPSRKCWEVDLPSPLTAHSLERAIKRNHALGSRDIEFSESDDYFGGTIYVGMCRPVGTWRVLERANVSEAARTDSVVAEGVTAGEDGIEFRPGQSFVEAAASRGAVDRRSR